MDFTHCLSLPTPRNAVNVAETLCVKTVFWFEFSFHTVSEFGKAMTSELECLCELCFNPKRDGADLNSCNAERGHDNQVVVRVPHGVSLGVKTLR